jgi:heptaprenylglyceryl phosphate synthase
MEMMMGKKLLILFLFFKTITITQWRHLFLIEPNEREEESKSFKMATQ